MKKLYYLLIAFSLCGCSQKWRDARDIKKLDALSIQQPSEFLRLSDLINPCFKGVAKSDTVTISHIDTLVQKGDTVKTIHKDTITLKITLPGKIITKTITKTIHDTIPDLRKIATLEAQVKDCSKDQITKATQLADKDATARKRLYWIIGLSLLIVIYAAIKVYILISGGWLKKIV